MLLVMLIKLFISPTCPKCSQVKEFAERLKQRGYNVKIVDTSVEKDTVEALLHNVYQLPTFLVLDDNDEELFRINEETDLLEDFLNVG